MGTQFRSSSGDSTKVCIAYPAPRALVKRAHDTLTPSRYGFTNTLYLWLVSAKPISSEATATWRHHWEKKKTDWQIPKLGDSCLPLSRGIPALFTRSAWSHSTCPQAAMKRSASARNIHSTSQFGATTPTLTSRIKEIHLVMKEHTRDSR